MWLVAVACMKVVLANIKLLYLRVATYLVQIVFASSSRLKPVLLTMIVLRQDHH